MPTPKGWSLIQRNLTLPKQERGYLAFDKCTLLSSQGSDAPPTQPSQSGPKGNFSILPVSFRLSNRHAVKIRTSSVPRADRAEATSLAYPFRSGCQIDRHPVREAPTSDRSVSVTRSEELIEVGVVLRLRGVKLSASPLPCGANK